MGESCRCTNIDGVDDEICKLCIFCSLPTRRKSPYRSADGAVVSTSVFPPTEEAIDVVLINKLFLSTSAG